MEQAFFLRQIPLVHVVDNSVPPLDKPKHERLILF